MKSSLILFGLLILLSFSGFKQAGFFFFLNSIILAAGSFAVCLGVLIEKDLAFYEKLFNNIMGYLSKESRGKYASWILRVSSKMKGLCLQCKNSRIILLDNPSIPNNEETRMYDELIIFSLLWLKRNLKNSRKAIGAIKEYYNSQKMLTKKLSQFSL
jgi:hypothetical protein